MHGIPKNSLFRASQKLELKPTSVHETLDLKHQDTENDFRIILIPLTPKITLNRHLHKLLVLNARLEKTTIHLYLCQQKPKSHFPISISDVPPHFSDHKK